MRSVCAMRWGRDAGCGNYGCRFDSTYSGVEDFLDQQMIWVIIMTIMPRSEQQAWLNFNEVQIRYLLKDLFFSFKKYSTKIVIDF